MVAWWQLEHARLGSGFQLHLERASREGAWADSGLRSSPSPTLRAACLPGPTVLSTRDMAADCGARWAVPLELGVPHTL